MAGNNLHVSDGVGVINTPTITSIRAVGNNIIQCDSLAHFPTGKFYATTYGTKTDTSGNTVVDESTIQDFVGTALNNQITIISFCPGYTDKGNKAGDYVVVKPTAASANDVADRLDTTVYDHALAVVNNENLSSRSPGVVSGLAITAPTSGTTVSIGGSLTVVDEAIVADTNGKKSRIASATKPATQLNIAIPSMTSGQSVNIAIIAHKSATANNGTWAYVAVPGTPATAGSQQPPTKSQIESVVPSGANGQFYAIIGTAVVPQGASSITQGMLTVNNATIPSQNVDFAKNTLFQGTASGATSSITTKITAPAAGFVVGKMYLAIAQFRRYSSTTSDFDTYLSGGGMLNKEGVDTKGGWSYITLASLWRYTSGDVTVSYQSNGAANTNAWLEIYEIG